jgi:hypothetical protein
MVGSTFQKLCPREKSPQYPLDRRLGGPQKTGLDDVEKILVPTRTRTSNPRSSSPYKVAILTALSWLPWTKFQKLTSGKVIFCGLPYGRKFGSHQTLHHVAAANHQPASPRLLKLSQATNRVRKASRNISALETDLQRVGNLGNPVGKFSSDTASDVGLNKISLKFEVLTAVNMKNAIFDFLVPVRAPSICEPEKQGLKFKLLRPPSLQHRDRAIFEAEPQLPKFSTRSWNYAQ